MLMKVHDTIKLCNRYIVLWFMDIPLGIGIGLSFFYWFTLGISETTTTNERIVLFFVFVLLLILTLSSFIAWLFVVILLFINLGKLNEILGINYSTYVTLLILGPALLPILSLIACFLIKRDLNHYIQTVSETPAVITESINPAVDAVD